MEIAPFSSVLLRLPVTLLFLWLRLISRICLLGSSFSYFGCCGFAYPNSRLLWCLNFCSILIAYQYTTPSDDISGKSISVWMYLCRALRYFKTRCRSESLILNLVRKVWKVLVNSRTSWSLSCHNVVHLYWSS